MSFQEVLATGLRNAVAAMDSKVRLVDTGDKSRPWLNCQADYVDEQLGLAGLRVWLRIHPTEQGSVIFAEKLAEALTKTVRQFYPEKCPGTGASCGTGPTATTTGATTPGPSTTASGTTSEPSGARCCYPTCSSETCNSQAGGAWRKPSRAGGQPLLHELGRELPPLRRRALRGLGDDRSDDGDDGSGDDDAGNDGRRDSRMLLPGLCRSGGLGGRLYCFRRGVAFWPLVGE